MSFAATLLGQQAECNAGVADAGIRKRPQYKNDPVTIDASLEIGKRISLYIAQAFGEEVRERLGSHYSSRLIRTKTIVEPAKS